MKRELVAEEAKYVCVGDDAVVMSVSISIMKRTADTPQTEQ